jgi:hypothetical protein
MFATIASDLQSSDQAAGATMFRVVSGEMAFDVKPIAGAPYSAQATSETVQTLADGNRITHTSTSFMARDSQGRTRREQTLDLLPLGGQAPPRKMVFIHDPVAQTSYILNPDHTAQKMPLVIHVPPPGGSTASLSLSATSSSQHKIEFTASLPAGKWQVSTEQLGQQTMEGVPVEGKRVTTVIPAGAVGNEQPISMVTETWYSPDLKTMVATTVTDPRVGTTTFKLTNLQRSEPSPDLFQVPADYTVTEGPKDGPMIMRQIQTVTK